MATVLSGSYADFVEAFLCRDNIVYNLVHVFFVESVTRAVHRFFHILGYSIFGQSRSMRMLGFCLCIHKDDYSIIYAASVYLYSFSFVLLDYVDRVRLQYPQVIQSRRNSFPVERILVRLQNFPFL
jgi:hypothetical protein